MSKISPDMRKFPDFNWNTRDRPRRWQDIFLDSPENEIIIYEPDTSLFDQAEAQRKAGTEKQNAGKKRERK